MRKVDLKTVLLSGTVFDILGLLTKINVLYDSLNIAQPCFEACINGLLAVEACSFLSML